MLFLFWIFFRVSQRLVQSFTYCLVTVSLQFKVRLGFGEVRLELGCSWFRTLFRFGSELLCFIESWLNSFSEGLARRSIYDWLKTLLMVAGLLAGSLAYFLACFHTCLLAAFLACLPACKVVACSGLPEWLACLLAGWLACLLACPIAPLLAVLHACILACLHACLLAGLLACWLAGLAGWLPGLPACLLCSVAQLLSCSVACLLPCLACLLAGLLACLLAWPAWLACLLACLLASLWKDDRGKKIPGEGEKIHRKNSAPFQGANRSHPDRAETPTDPVI